MGFFPWGKARAFEDDPEVSKLLNANVTTIRIALGILGRPELIGDVSDLLDKPIAIGYIFGAPGKSSSEVLERYGDDVSARFTNYVFQFIFTGSAANQLRSKAMELYSSPEHAEQMRDGANLAIRDIQTLVSNWVRGIPPSSATEGYKISWRNPQ